MKKIQKKLVLKKKTIAQLSEQAIDNDKIKQVQGGISTGNTRCCPVVFEP